MLKKIPLFLTLLFLSVFINEYIYSQCTPNTSYTNPGFYPDTFPDGTVNVLYDEDFTVVFRKDTVIGGLTFDINKVVLHSFNGLPIGMNWQSNETTNTFYPQSNQYACVNFNGTPIATGTYPIYINATVSFGGLIGDQPFIDTFYLDINPAVANNNSFSISNSSGCEPLDVSFSSSASSSNIFDWDFGDGNGSTDASPNHTYQSAGTYIITQQVTPNATPDYYLTDITINAVPDNDLWEDKFEIYFIIYDANSNIVFQGYDEKNNPNDETYLARDAVLPFKFSLPNITLDPEYYKVEVWDLDDGFMGGDDDELGSASFYGQGSSGNVTGYTTSGSGGVLNFDYGIYENQVITITTSDTIEVYPMPTTPTLNLSGSTEFCDGDSLVLTSSSSTDNQWYKDGGMIIGETAQNYTTYEEGNYYVLVSNQYGCTVNSTDYDVVVNDAPLKPSYWNESGTLKTALAGYDLQWYLDGQPISGANQKSYTYTQSGYYSVSATNDVGCTTFSSEYYYEYSEPQSILELSMLKEINVYPNPNDGAFKVSVALLRPESFMVSVTNILGQPVYSKHFLGVSEINELINLNETQSGIYQLQLIIDGNIVTRNIVVR